MSEGVPIQVCTACSKALFPPRVVCPGCGGSVFSATMVETGVLEERTEHRGTPIGAVRTAAGPVVIARLEGTVGDVVRLGMDNGAPVARPG
jgi:uncharacterized OB-fold protein